MKKILLAAVAIAALASCSNDDVVDVDVYKRQGTKNGQAKNWEIPKWGMNIFKIDTQSF